MTNLSEKIVTFFEKYEVIDSEDREVYLYGLDRIIGLLLNLIVFLLIGLAFNSIGVVAIFCLLFIPLRSYAGGYHAPTEFSCFMSSNIMVLSCVLLVKLMNGVNINIVVILLLMAVIWLLGPIESKSKPLDELEVKVYTRRLRYLLLLEGLIISFGVYLGVSSFSVIAIIVFGMIILLDVIGIVEKRVFSSL